jgi:hypothetical protein
MNPKELGSKILQNERIGANWPSIMGFGACKDKNPARLAKL